MAQIAVVSGGTATNSILDIFQQLAHDQNQSSSESQGRISYILPISDNGGSTSEIIRVLGGCSVGDIRSRITRLIPDESSGLRALLSHRLSRDPAKAKEEWSDIVEGSHPLWIQVDPPCKQILRSFLIHVHTEILKRSRNTQRNFHLELASVGNLFLTGGRLFCGSLDSSIELMLRLTRVPSNIEVLPCINTNFTYHISALLKNGAIITGQSQISHPSVPESHKLRENGSPRILLHEHHSVANHSLHVARSNDILMQTSAGDMDDDDETKDSGFSSEDDDSELDAPSYIHPELKKSQLHFNKDDSIPLPAPIKRIFYISPYGEEIYPAAHNRVLKCFKEADTVIYSIGSLMTSIIPILILQGVGEAILSHRDDQQKRKILLINGTHDRETYGMTAVDFILAICDALRYSMRFGSKNSMSLSAVNRIPPNEFVSHVIYLSDHSEVTVETEKIQYMGIKCVAVRNKPGSDTHYNLHDLYKKLSNIGTGEKNL